METLQLLSDLSWLGGALDSMLAWPLAAYTASVDFCVRYPWEMGSAGALFVAWVLFWQYQGYMLSHRSGYFAPRLTVAPQMVRWLVSTLIGAWFIGRVQVKGWENIEGLEGNIIIGPNHQIESDVWLVGMGLGRREVRFLMSINQTKGILRGPFFAWMGAISVGYDKKNKASAAADSAVKALSDKKQLGKRKVLLIFPQGALIRDDVWSRKQFFNGEMKISRLAGAQTGEAYWHVPAVAHYNFDPRHGTAFQRFVHRLGISRRFFGHTVFGATIYIGKPLKRSELPEDDAAAMDVYYERMVDTRKLCLHVLPGRTCRQEQD
jgi:1-acyl-sn-glycerol-3-phosphate acyltransferase